MLNIGQYLGLHLIIKNPILSGSLKVDPTDIVSNPLSPPSSEVLLKALERGKESDWSLMEGVNREFYIKMHSCFQRIFTLFMFIRKCKG